MRNFKPLNQQLPRFPRQGIHRFGRHWAVVQHPQLFNALIGKRCNQAMAQTSLSSRDPDNDRLRIAPPIGPQRRLFVERFLNFRDFHRWYGNRAAQLILKHTRPRPLHQFQNALQRWLWQNDQPCNQPVVDIAFVGQEFRTQHARFKA